MKPYFLGLSVLQVDKNKSHIRIYADFSDDQHCHVNVPTCCTRKQVAEALRELATKIEHPPKDD